MANSSNMSNMSNLGLRRTRSARVSSGLHYSVLSNMSRAHEAPPSFRVPTPTRTTRPLPPPPKPKFSLQEQLNILKRLKSGDFSSKGGVEQFQAEKDRVGTVRSKSMYATAEGMKKMKPNKYAPVPLPPLSSPSQPLPNFAEFMGGPGGKTYAKMPAHIKLFDKVIVLQISAFKMLYNHATRSANATFSRILKPKNIRLLVYRVVQVTHILQKFLKLGQWDKAHTFMPSKIQMRGAGQRRHYLHTPVKDQTKTRLAILKAGQVLEKLRLFMKGKKTDDLDPKMERLRELLDTWEGNREELDTLNKQWDKLRDVAEELEDEDSDSDTDTDSMTITSEESESDSNQDSDSNEDTETSSTD